MRSKSIIPSITSTPKALPPSRVVPRRITDTRRPSAAALARPRDIPGLFSRRGETAASGCCLGLSLGDRVSPGSARIAAADARQPKVQYLPYSALRPSWRGGGENGGHRHPYCEPLD